MALMTTVAMEISVLPYGSHRISEPANGNLSRVAREVYSFAEVVALVERAGDTVLYRGMTRRWFCSGAAVFQEASRFVPMSLSFLTSYPPWQFQPGASGQQTFGDYASVRYRQGKSVAQPTVSDGGAGPRGAIHGCGMLRLRNTVNLSL